MLPISSRTLAKSCLIGEAARRKDFAAVFDVGERLVSYLRIDSARLNPPGKQGSRLTAQTRSSHFQSTWSINLLAQSVRRTFSRVLIISNLTERN